MENLMAFDILRGCEPDANIMFFRKRKKITLNPKPLSHASLCNDIIIKTPTPSLDFFVKVKNKFKLKRFMSNAML